MANAKITELTVLTTSAGEDLLAIVDDPSGTPITKRISIAALFGNVPTDLMPSADNAYDLGSPDKRWKALVLGTGKLLLGDAEIEHETEVHQPVYLSGQTGLNDLSSSGTYPLAGNAVFQIKVQSTGTPDNFEWRKGTLDAWTGPVAMTGSAQLLQDGVSITWAATTGHTLNDEWEMAVGHMLHISEAVHIGVDAIVDGDLVVEGSLRSLSPVKIAGGLELLGEAKIETGLATMTFIDATTGTKTLAELAAGANINQTTGWLEGAQVTINAGDDTKIDISPGSVQIVTGTDNPVATIISWSETITFDPGLSSYTNWIGIRDDGSGGPEVVNQILFNAEERRYTALLGKVRDNAGTGPSITNIDDFERPAWGITTAFHDFVLAHGSFSIKGNDITASATDGLRLNKSAGESFRYHTEDAIGRENHHYDAAQLPRTSYDYHVQGSSQLVNHDEIQPNLMEDGAGGTKAVPTNKYTRQEIRIWPVSGAFHMTYGQEEFNSLQLAIDSGPEPMADINTKMTNGAIHIASLVIQEGTLSILSAIGTGNAKIIPLAGGGGGSGGGGISNIVEDTTPQLGGDLDVQTNAIIATGTNPITFDTSGNERMSIFSNGNVRINSVAVGDELSVLGSKTSAVGATIWNLLGTDVNAHAKLSLNSSDVGGGDPLIAFNIANVTGWVFGVDNSDGDKMKFDTSAVLGNSTVMTIQRDGNVGFGTSDPDRMVHVKGSNANFHLEREDQNGATFFFSNINGANTTHWKMEALNNWAGAGSGVFNIADDGTDSGGTSTTRFTIDENGNVGIGTTTPGSTLEVVGNINATTSITAPSLRIDPSAYYQMQGGNPLIAFDGNDYLTFNRTSNSLEYYVGGSGKFKIDANGNVGIGANNPTSKLQVVGLPIYANNAAAITRGLTAGAFYRTGGDPDPACVVH